MVEIDPEVLENIFKMPLIHLSCVTIISTFQRVRTFINIEECFVPSWAKIGIVFSEKKIIKSLLEKRNVFHDLKYIVLEFSLLKNFCITSG